MNQSEVSRLEFLPVAGPASVVDGFSRVAKAAAALDTQAPLGQLVRE